MVADWNVPFLLTSSTYSATPLDLNAQAADGYYYMLRLDGCSLTNTVRSTKEYVPQEDGAILHRRFSAGMEMSLTVQLWETIGAGQDGTPACEEVLQEMIDTLMGYAYGLLNAGDNEGRVQWLPYGNSSAASSYRMLDDVRLLTYPVGSQAPGGVYEVSFTVDCELPYAEDATQVSESLTGGSGTIVNYGNRDLYPVWQIWGPFASATVTNTTTGIQFVWDETLPGAGVAITNAQYLEIETFRNTVSMFYATTATGVNIVNSATINVASTDGWPATGSFTMSGVTTTYTGIGATTLTGCGNHPATTGGEVILNTEIANRAAGIDMLNSEFFTIPPGSNAITVGYTSGNTTNNNSSVALVNSAFA